MTSIALDHPRDDAKTIIKASLELMDSIDVYTDEGQRIVGKQEASLMGGNGARLVIDVPEMQENNEKTIIEANAEKEVSIDMATNPEDIKSNFLNTINHLRKRNMDELLDEMAQEITPENSKEVTSSRNFGNTQSTLGKKFIIIFIVFTVFSLLFGVMMTAVMIP